MCTIIFQWSLCILTNPHNQRQTKCFGESFILKKMQFGISQTYFADLYKFSNLVLATEKGGMGTHTKWVISVFLKKRKKRFYFLGFLKESVLPISLISSTAVVKTLTLKGRSKAKLEKSRAQYCLNLVECSLPHNNPVALSDLPKATERVGVSQG